MHLLAIFAEAAPDASSAAGAIWLTGAFAAAGGVTAVINLAALFATRREVEALEKRVTETRKEQEERDRITAEALVAVRREIAEGLTEARSEIAEMERRLNQSGEHRAKETHDRINEVLSAVSHLSGRVGVDLHRK